MQSLVGAQANSPALASMSQLVIAPLVVDTACSCQRAAPLAGCSKVVYATHAPSGDGSYQPTRAAAGVTGRLSPVFTCTANTRSRPASSVARANSRPSSAPHRASRQSSQPTSGPLSPARSALATRSWRDQRSASRSAVATSNTTWRPDGESRGLETRRTSICIAGVQAEALAGATAAGSAPAPATGRVGAGTQPASASAVAPTINGETLRKFCREQSARGRPASPVEVND